MQVTKITCDRCQQEIPNDRSGSRLTLQASDCVGGLSSTVTPFDLCGSCLTTFRLFMRKAPGLELAPELVRCLQEARTLYSTGGIQGASTALKRVMDLVPLW